MGQHPLTGDPGVATDARPPTHCYVCGASASTDALACPRCSSVLVLSEPRRMVGIAYLLNRLPDLVASGTIDADTAARLKARMEAELAQDVVPARGIASPRSRSSRRISSTRSRPGRSTDEFLAEQAPSLLLYVGAFLIVVSALIFVNVSGEQISDVLKLALMVVGTVGFLGAGLLLHRFPRVLPAGRTFLVIGALLVPIDVAATYALFLRTEPWTSPTLWLAGSILAAILYAALAIAGFGPTYARLFFAATVSAAGALLASVEAAPMWQLAALVGLGLAHTVVSQRVTNPRARTLTQPLLLPAQLLIPIPLSVVAFVIGTTWLFGSLTGSGVNTSERTAIALAILLGTANYGLFLRQRTARPAALIGAGLVPLSWLFVVDASADAYALALIALGAVYAFAHLAVARQLAPGTLPADAWTEMRRLGYLWVFVALGLIPHYANAPGTGAIAYLGAAVISAASLLTATPVPASRSDPATSSPFSIRLRHPLVYLAAGALLVGVRYGLLAMPFTPAAIRGPLADGGELGWAFAALLASFVLIGGTILTTRYRPGLRDAFAASALLCASLATFLTRSDDAYRATFAATYAAVFGVGAVAAKAPKLLWGAGAFAAVGVLAALAWQDAPRDVWPIALSAAGLAPFVVGLVGRATFETYARVLRELGAAGAALAAVTGYALQGSPGFPPTPDDPLWRSTTGALVVLAVLLAAEGRVRRSFDLFAAASGSALIAVLMQIAVLRPSDAQAYSATVGAYLIVLAALALRYGPPTWLERLPIIEGAGALVLLGPTYLATWGPEGVGQGIRLLVEISALLAIGLILQGRWLIAIAVTFIGLEAVRVLVDAVDRLPNWVIFATSGTLLLAIGFVLLLKRELWVRWQGRISTWWRAWSPGAAPR